MKGSIVTAALSGGLFALGLAVAGMTQPDKVIGFLDVFGAWDPDLAFVMAGAIAVNAPTYFLIRRRSAPFLLPKWSLPSRRDVDKRLVAGGALFGVGWGLGGYCPGPALTSLPSASGAVITFTLAMLAGMALFQVWERRGAAQRSASAHQPSPLSSTVVDA